MGPSQDAAKGEKRGTDMKLGKEKKMLDQSFRHVVRRLYIRLLSLSDEEREERRKWILERLHDIPEDDECRTFVEGLFDAVKVSKTEETEVNKNPLQSGNSKRGETKNFTVSL